jgi:hypothetical protein
MERSERDTPARRMNATGRRQGGDRPVCRRARWREAAERSSRRQLPRPGQRATLGSGRLSSLRPIDLALAADVFISAEDFIPAAGVCMGMPIIVPQ